MKRLFLYLLFLFPMIGAGQDLPKPSGPYASGVRDLFLTDPSRADSALGGQISVRVWYPASGSAGGRNDYLPEGLQDALQQIGYAHLDSPGLARLAGLRSNSIRDAKPAAGRKFPVVLFSPGWGMATFSYTALIEELVSLGTIIVAIDHLYCGPVRLPGGRIITGRDYPFEKYGPYLQAALRDTRFVMRSLRAATDGFAFLAGMTDPERSGVMGHSIGGNVALLAARETEPFRFAINLDGGAFDEAAPGTMKIPALTLRSFPVYSDAELSSKGRTRAAWNAMGEAIDSTFRANLERTRSASVEVKIPSTGHMSFSDAPFLMPDMLTRFGGAYLSPKATLRITSALILSFIRNSDPESLKRFPERLKREKIVVRVFGP